MKDSMTKFNHKIIAEQSIYNFIEFMEKDTGEKISESDIEWLLKKGIELFDTYYIGNQIKVGLSSQEDKETLEAYLAEIQESLGRMFSHIILLEYKLHLIFD